MDPFLFAHKRTGVPLFDLSIRLSTISVRDQVTRALLLAERLPEWLQSQLGANYAQKPLLVVGAGVCGMTAAVALAQRGLTVEIAERDGHLFNLQRNCVSRWLDPTQYDWPLDNWRRGRFPQQRTHQRAPFTWKSDVARKIAQRWGGQLSRHWRLIPGLASRLVLRRSIEASLNLIYNSQLRLMRVQFNNPRTHHFVGFGDYGAVIWAFGHGDERCDLRNSPHFKGLPFWHNDSLESNHCGLAGQAQEGTVLISGSGDGALQDFLRVVTRVRSARDIYDRLQLKKCDINVHKILSAEHCAERAINWSSGGSFANPYMLELQTCHEQVVKSILGNAGLQGRIDALVANRPQSTILVTRQTCFTCIYPLNRFLTLLILNGSRDGSIQWRHGFEVHGIQSINHPPAQPTPVNCIGHPWRVTLHSTQNIPQPQSIDANVVLMRHGIDSPETTLPPVAPLPPMARPIPPVHLL